MSSIDNAYVPDYVAARIRNSAPHGCGVIPGTTPVVSFGNAATASTATLGINPSSKEFLSGSVLLAEPKRRLATLESIGASDSRELSDLQVQAILKDCYNYFHKNPYMAWFKHLEMRLNEVGLSYIDGTACHLDLVQSATSPIWGKLTADVQQKLINQDISFLEQQIAQENIATIIVNGRTVWNTLKQFNLAEIDEVSNSYYGPSKTRISYFEGRGLGTRFLGWSANLQQMQATREARAQAQQQISEWLLENFNSK